MLNNVQRFACFMAIMISSISLATSVAQGEVYELRTYTTHPGKLDHLNTRFRDHTVKLFEKHGMENIGYWVPTDDPASANTLIYVLKHQSQDAAKASWKAFLADPAWQKAFKASRKDGSLLAKKPESVFMQLADYSPKYKESDGDNDEAVFELRTYRTNPGKLDKLDARFRDHTIRIFSRHGMESVMYWHPIEEPDSQDTLIYVLKHQSRKAAKESWDAFRSDNEWKKVAAESQVDGPFLRERPKSIYMKATDYSLIR